MITYAAFLRGIMPTNPNMRNEKIIRVFEDLGFTDVKAIISSGNFIFSSSSKNQNELESQIEKALYEKLEFKSDTFIRSKKELVTLVEKDPFDGKEHSKKTYLIITFLKKKPFELYNVVDTTTQKTPDFMQKINKEYGRENTTRTWNTIQKMLTKMS